MNSSTATNLVLQTKSLVHSKPVVARPKVAVKIKIIFVCLDVVCHSARSCLYLRLQVLSEPMIVDVARELRCVHDLDRLSIMFRNLEKTETLAFNAQGAVIQLSLRKMRDHVGQIT